MACTAPCQGTELLSEGVLLHHPDLWNDLLQRSFDNRIFLTADWLRIWSRHFRPAEVAVVRHCDEDRTWIAALPLHIENRDGRRTITLLGDYNLADYMDGLAERGRAHELLFAIWSCVLEDLAPESIDLRHVPATSPMISALISAGEQHGWQVDVEPDEVCPVALLCSSWDGYVEMLSKKQRHEIRRKLRRAQEGAQSEWRTAQSHDDVDRNLPVFFRLHEASARDKSDFMTPAMRSYFEDLAHSLLDLGYLRLSVLRRDDADIASTIGFVYRDRYLLYNSGYDPAYAVYSPGIVAAVRAMQDAIEEKCVAFDFLSGDEPYKYQLGATNTYTCRVLAQPLNPARQS